MKEQPEKYKMMGFIRDMNFCEIKTTHMFGGEFRQLLRKGEEVRKETEEYQPEQGKSIYDRQRERERERERERDRDPLSFATNEA